MYGQLAHRLGQGPIATGDGTPITGATEIFCGKETETAHISPTAHRPTGPAGSSGLGTILNHLQAMAACDGTEPLHVHRATEQVHW